MEKFDLIPKKHFTFVISAILVIAMGIMAFVLTKQLNEKNFSLNDEIKNINTVTESNNLDQIEADLKNTDLDDVDKELQDIETELKIGY